MKLKTGDCPGKSTVVGVGEVEITEELEERRGGGGDAKKSGEVTTTGDEGGDRATAWIGEVDPVEEVDISALAGKSEGEGKNPRGLGIGLGKGALSDNVGYEIWEVDNIAEDADEEVEGFGEVKVKFFRKSLGELDCITCSVDFGEVAILGDGDKVEEGSDVEGVGDRIEGLGELKEYIFSGETDEFGFSDVDAFDWVRDVTFSCNSNNSCWGDPGAEVVKGSWGIGTSWGSDESTGK